MCADVASASTRSVRCGRAPRAATWLLLLATLGGTATAHAAEWYVLCDLATGDVVLREGFVPDRQRVLAGPLPGERTAAIWADENCPVRSCDSRGRCGARESDRSSGASGGWVAGELSSVTLGGAEAGGAAAGRSPAPPADLTGPGEADLSPLIATATGAAKACSFPAALVSAEQMANFDPEHPWYVANHAKLQGLAERQRRTERLVWQASSALSAEALERARELAAEAASSAVSCQTRAVSDLLAGIETAILQRKRARSAANRAAAAALLPGLIDLSRALSGAQAGASPGVPAAAPPASFVSGGGLVAAPDPCSYQYRYPSKWSVEPICTCPGYAFDARSFRCVR